ncbi:MAG: flotillin-like FloA family protein, partial [Planctomycetota bacterium]
MIALIGLGLIVCLIGVAIVLNFGGLWIRAYTSNARVSVFSLIGMKLRQVNAATIVDAKVMAMQAGV